MTTDQLSVSGVEFDARALLPYIRGTCSLNSALHGACVMLSRTFKYESAGIEGVGVKSNRPDTFKLRFLNLVR
jgi:hypothetical protein